MWAAVVFNYQNHYCDIYFWADWTGQGESIETIRDRLVRRDDVMSLAISPLLRANFCTRTKDLLSLRLVENDRATRVELDYLEERVRYLAGPILVTAVMHCQFDHDLVVDQHTSIIDGRLVTASTTLGPLAPRYERKIR